jgi:hypothetical protein
VGRRSGLGAEAVFLRFSIHVLMVRAEENRIIAGLFGNIGEITLQKQRNYHLCQML